MPTSSEWDFIGTESKYRVEVSPAFLSATPWGNPPARWCSQGRIDAQCAFGVQFKPVNAPHAKHEQPFHPASVSLAVMFIGITNSWLYCAYRATNQIELRDGSIAQSRQGTAFFVRRSDGEQCLITNRHLVDPGYGEATGKYLGARLTGFVLQGFSAAKEDAAAVPSVHNDFIVALDRCTFRYAANYEEDVACIVRPMLCRVGQQAVHLDYFFEAAELATDNWSEQNLVVCDLVAFPGYPPWYDKSDGRPLVRTGTIASEPRMNYSDTTQPRGRRIAYEAFSFGGSSGSPVIASPKLVPGSTGTVLREGRVVGINAGHFTGESSAHSGISYFIKASAILDLIAEDGSLTPSS